MTWELVFQSFTLGLSGIATWFIYEHIKDFKSFKKEAHRDIQSLQKERTHFESLVRDAGLGISHRVLDLQRLHNDFALNIQKSVSSVSFEIEKIKTVVKEIQDKSVQHEAYLRKSLDLARHFSEKIKGHDEAIKSIKIELGETTIFKKKADS